METIKLPIEKAHEPDEEARQPLEESNKPKKRHTTFADDVSSTEKEPSQTSRNEDVSDIDVPLAGKTRASRVGAVFPRGRCRHRTQKDDDLFLCSVLLPTRRVPSPVLLCICSILSAYKEALSQPAPGLSHRHRLAWLQRRRGPGLWAQCDACDAWRHLPRVAEPRQLPERWYCSMNPDKAMADCSIPEAPLRIMDEEDLIHSEYSAGSLVWARLAGWPWWPAMVDDCPDTEQFYWLDGFSDIPTHYNVVFFDSTGATRAWIAPENLKPYTPNKSNFRNLLIAKRYKKRMENAVQQADKAEKLPVLDRLAKFSFISTYKGAIMSPKKISKRELERFQNKLKRKYNVDFPAEELLESEDESVRAFREKNKRRNVILIGTPKSKKAKRLISSNDIDKDRNRTHEKQNVTTDENDDDKEDMKKKGNEEAKNNEFFALPKDSANEKDSARNTINTDETIDQPSTNAVSTDTFKHPNSMAIEIGSTQTLNLGSEISGIDNDSSKTYMPELPEQGSDPGVVSQDFRIRIETPSSDEFEF